MKFANRKHMNVYGFSIIFATWYPKQMEYLSPKQQNENLQEGSRPLVSRSNRFFEREYIDSLREDVVKDILVTILRKAGNEKALVNFIPFKDLITFQNANDKTSGSYYAETHTIELNKHNLLQDEEELTGATKSITLATILHEELHAVTNQNFVITTGDFEGKRQTGFQTETIDAVTRESLGKTWVRFNEGITELIKDDILAEYIQRTGDRKEFLIKGYESGVEQSSYQTYLEERAFVSEIFSRVSTLTGIPFEIVREAFVQAYFSGKLRSDIEGSLKEIGGADLLSRMDDVVSSDLKERFRDNITKYAYDSAQTKDDIRKCVEEYLVYMCTNYLKRSLV